MNKRTLYAQPRAGGEINKCNNMSGEAQRLPREAVLSQPGQCAHLNYLYFFNWLKGKGHVSLVEIVAGAQGRVGGHLPGPSQIPP